MTVSTRSLGAKLRRVFDSRGAYAILLADPKLGDATWGEGGCWLAARALAAAAPGSILVGVVEPVSSRRLCPWQAREPTIHHVAVQLADGRVIDCDGAWTAAGFLRRWRKTLDPSVELRARPSAVELRASGLVPGSLSSFDALTRVLRANLGADLGA